jgi:hypothetical protein
VPVSCRPQRSCFGRRGGATGPRRPDRPQRSRSWRRCCRPPPSNSTSTASTASRAGLGRDLRGARRQAAGDVPRLPRRGAELIEPAGAEHTPARPGARPRWKPHRAHRLTPRDHSTDRATEFERSTRLTRKPQRRQPPVLPLSKPSCRLVGAACVEEAAHLLLARERATVAAVPDRAGDDGDAVLAAGGDSLLGHAARADGAVQPDAGDARGRASGDDILGDGRPGDENDEARSARHPRARPRADGSSRHRRSRSPRLRG